jgi:hypothetical protein
LAVLIRKAGDELFADRRRRAETMLEAAAEAADMTADEQADATSQSERTRFMADAAVRAAAESMWTPGAPLPVSFPDPDPRPRLSDAGADTSSGRPLVAEREAVYAVPPTTLTPSGPPFSEL